MTAPPVLPGTAPGSGVGAAACTHTPTHVRGQRAEHAWLGVRRARTQACALDRDHVPNDRSHAPRAWVCVRASARPRDHAHAACAAPPRCNQPASAARVPLARAPLTAAAAQPRVFSNANTSQHRNECALWWGVAAAAAACTACRATRTPAAPCPHVLPGCSSALPLCLPVPPTPTGNGVHRTPAPCTLRHALLAHSSAGGRCCATDPWGWQWAAAAADPVALEIHLSSSPGAWWPNRAAPAALHTRAAGGALQRPALGHDSC